MHKYRGSGGEERNDDDEIKGIKNTEWLDIYPKSRYSEHWGNREVVLVMSG